MFREISPSSPFSVRSCFRFLRPQAAEETADPEAKRAHKQDLQIWSVCSLESSYMSFDRFHFLFSIPIPTPVSI